MSDDDSLTPSSVETQSDIGLTPRDEVRRWLLELKLSAKGEEKWRKSAERVYERYRGTDKRKNSFNILWSNTETLRPAIYNSTPQPDIRRRFRDADPLGKAVSEVLNRSLEFCSESYDIDTCLKAAVLDGLLVGRGTSRIRYIPSFRQTGESADAAPATDELSWEQASGEHVSWQDYRRGSGRRWEEVQWIAFRHRLNRKEMVEKFGKEIGDKIELTGTHDADVEGMREKDPVKELFNTGEVWELWDRENKKVLFISQGYPDAPCKSMDDPYGLEGFFPIPKPMQFIEDTDRLVPIVPFTLYEEQANELDNAVYRRNKIIDALKVRGVYDSTITEMSQVMKGNDNDLIAASNVAAFMERGGLDKMIWFMPIDMAAAVLKELDATIDRCIDGIYQICGIADIMRASSDPQETATAQKLKSTWGSMRLQKMQREVQRYARDFIRLMAQVISKKFQQETLKAMTGLPYPTMQEVQQQMMQLQQQNAMAQQQGQQPQPMPPMAVTWEQIVQTLHDDAMRSYRVDIETDSTVADQLSGDMQGLTEVLGGITQFITGIAPAVQQQAVPIDAVKEVVLTICRRARMGSAVEDAWEKIKEPAPQADPEKQKQETEMQKMQAQQQSDAAKMQQEGQLEQMKMQHEKEIEQFRQQMQAAQVQHQNDLESQRAVQEAQLQAQLKQQEIQSSERLKAAELQHQQAELTSQEQIQAHARATQLEIAGINAASAERLKAMELQHNASMEGSRQDHEQKLETHRTEQAKANKPPKQEMPDVGGMLERALAPIREQLNRKPEGAREIIVRNVNGDH